MKTRRFRIGPQGGYREGVLYPQGSIIELPDDDKPENQPSDTWIPLKDGGKDDVEKEADQGAFTIAARAENPNPLPPTPFTSKSFQAQGQYIPKAEGEKTVGELKREKDGPKTTNLGAVKASTHETAVAAAKAEAEAKRGDPDTKHHAGHHEKHK